MNVLITSFSFPSFENKIYDGKFVFSEALSYAENGANVRVITPHYYGAKKVERIHEQITVIRFQYFVPKSLQVLKKPGRPIYDQKSFLSIVQIPLICLFFVLKILRYASWAHIIHAQWTLAALLAFPAKWILGKKVVLTARGSDLKLFPKWLNRFIHSKVDAAIDCFGPQPWNDEYKKTFPAHYVRLPLIVHNGATGVMPEDMKRIISGKPDTFIILYVGRFDYIKINSNKLPLINLIHASKILREEGMDFHVFYIGDGNEQIRKEMLKFIDEHNLRDYVTLLGVKVNPPEYIEFCHVGLGGIAFNAVSQEFTINSKPQILVNGIDNADTPWCHNANCILIEPDDETDLADKLIWAIKNREQVEKIGENAGNEMSKYIVDSRIGGKLYLKEFQNLIS
ncbi:MAG: glycosyltransferase family 4 protein [Deltaproteobacteria bacterium]|nr:MAG: glycosyltransferase family 4 protein [Deltaproteobacteria bacterium]